MNSFIQEAPQLGNTYLVNPWLKKYLAYKGGEHFEHFDLALKELGEKCRKEYLEIAARAEREEPEHIPYDAWGNRIDELRVSKAWIELQDIAAREGMIATGYERKFAELSRVFQFAKLYLFHPSSAFFTCPLAMTDGAARLLELYGAKDSRFQAAFQHLTSRDPKQFWTSGQWMTEKTGGSDVSETSTRVEEVGGEFKLYGTKWFSSSTQSEMALALGRYEDSPNDGKGLSLFFVETHKPDGRLNNIEILRLKDKLGTKALPTAELELKGTKAFPIGEKNHGVKTVATMLNITRLYNSICSCGQMARVLDLLRDYAGRRKVFNHKLSAQPLHQVTYVHAELLHLTGLILTMHLVELMGKEETAKATDLEKDVLRLMTPVCKMYTGKSAISVVSEVLEGFGGAGYVENTGIAVHFRDAQVFPIWEGATNVLSLDILRVMQKGSALQSLLSDMTARLQKVAGIPNLKGQCEAYTKHVQGVAAQVKEVVGQKPEVIQANMRDFGFYLARLYSGILLLEWASAQPSMVAWSSVWLKHNLKNWSPMVPQDYAEIESVMKI